MVCHEAQESLANKKGEEKAPKALPVGWKKDTLSEEMNAEESFLSTFSRNTRSNATVVGAHGARGSFNSPLKAFKQVMTQGIRRKTVNHTNEYGKANDKGFILRQKATA